jgi:aspartyl-tRNA(Asn)/glutamyl-tRNA(Gln) amidotransferase subunit B
MSSYETVIGLEIHIQVGTASKIFCGCANTPTEPNLQVCPVCLGLPGALPVPNREAIRLTQTLAAAVGADLAPKSRFDRKHYFYPDLPKGYQISQYQHPLATGGSVQIDGREIGIERLHLEEDAGKNIHRGVETVVDLNRAGTPLIELVTRPELNSPAEARAFLEQLQELVRLLGVGEANMEKGELRVDANISLRRPGAQLGAKVEIKNMNSFRFMEQALQFEEKRQATLLDGGEAVVQETRGFVEKTGETTSQRTKEEARDYRYLPEPDLPPLEFTTRELAAISREAGERLATHRSSRAAEATDQETRRSAIRGLGLSDEIFMDSSLLGAMRQVLARSGNETFPRGLESLVLRSPELQQSLREGEAETINLLSDLVKALKSGNLVFSQAQQVVTEYLSSGETFAEISARLGFDQSVDMETYVAGALAEHPQAAADYRAGNDRALAALVGAIMKASGGRIDPAQATKLLKEKLK